MWLKPKKSKLITILVLISNDGFAQTHNEHDENGEHADHIENGNHTQHLLKTIGFFTE
jgi:hypothetical protein